MKSLNILRVSYMILGSKLISKYVCIYEEKSMKISWKFKD